MHTARVASAAVRPCAVHVGPCVVGRVTPALEWLRWLLLRLLLLLVQVAPAIGRLRGLLLLRVMVSGVCMDLRSLLLPLAFLQAASHRHRIHPLLA